MIFGLMMAGAGLALVVVLRMKDFRLKVPVALGLVAVLIVAMVNQPFSDLPDDEACGSGYLSRDC